MNYESIKVSVVARQAGLPIREKISRIILAPPNHVGPYRVPVQEPRIILMPGELPEREMCVTNYFFDVAVIDLELYQDKHGNRLRFGYNEKYSILVWQPETLKYGFKFVGA
jgi:hypothetical protein